MLYYVYSLDLKILIQRLEICSTKIKNFTCSALFTFKVIGVSITMSIGSWNGSTLLNGWLQLKTDVHIHYR